MDWWIWSVIRGRFSIPDMGKQKRAEQNKGGGHEDSVHGAEVRGKLENNKLPNYFKEISVVRARMFPRWNFFFLFFLFFFFHQSPRNLPFSLILINLVKKFPATPAGSSLLLPPLFPPVPLFLPLSPSFFPSLFFLNCVSKKKEGKENILIPRRYWQWQI